LQKCERTLTEENHGSTLWGVYYVDTPISVIYHRHILYALTLTDAKMTQRIILNKLHILGAVIFNILIPGAGFIWLGYYKKAFQIQALFWLVTIVTGWSRWILTPSGIQTYLLLLALMYISNNVYLFIILLNNKQHKWRIKHSLISLLFTFAGFAIVFGGFISKDHWLGVHIYFVPSMSMSPTLKPGQFIMLDTWAYHHHSPQLNDVVVFSHNDQHNWLVKRISPWPDGKLQQHDNWYVLGDNQAHSRDSRYFGGIKTQQLVGQVKMVLAEIDNQLQLQKGSYFQSIE